MSNGDTVFTSPNGLFTLSVTDNGISLAGPASSITLDQAGGVTVQAGGNVAVSSGGGVSVQGGSSTVTVGPGAVSVQAPSITLNGGSQPVARVGDVVTGSPGSGTGTIQSGNPTVLA